VYGTQRFNCLPAPAFFGITLREFLPSDGALFATTTPGCGGLYTRVQNHQNGCGLEIKAVALVRQGTRVVCRQCLWTRPPAPKAPVRRLTSENSSSLPKQLPRHNLRITSTKAILASASLLFGCAPEGAISPPNQSFVPVQSHIHAQSMSVGRSSPVCSSRSTLSKRLMTASASKAAPPSRRSRSSSAKPPRRFQGR
jgi:hypothetical protein